MRPERLLLALALAPLLATCQRGGDAEEPETSFFLQYSEAGGYDDSVRSLVIGTELGLEDWFAPDFDAHWGSVSEAYVVPHMTARRMLRTVRRSGFFEWAVENPTQGGDPVVRRLAVLSPEAKHQVADGGEKMSDLVDRVRKQARSYGQRLDLKVRTHEHPGGSGGKEIDGGSFDAKARLLATVHLGFWVGVWDAVTGRKVGVFPVASGGFSVGPPARLAFDPEGKSLALAERNGTIRVWDLQTQQEMAALVGHKERVAALAFSPDGKLLATASEDSTLKIWDWKSGITVASHLRQRFGDQAVAFSPDSQTLVIGHEGLELRRVSDWAKVAAFNACGVYSLSVSPRGRAVAIGTSDWLAWVWWLSDQPFAVPCRGHINRVICLAFSPNGQIVVSGSYDATAALWEARTGRCQALLWGHKGPVVAVAFSPDGKTLLSCSRDWTVRVWDTSDGRLLRVVNLGEEDKATATLPGKGR